MDLALGKMYKQSVKCNGLPFSCPCSLLDSIEHASIAVAARLLRVWLAGFWQGLSLTAPVRSCYTDIPMHLDTDYRVRLPFPMIMKRAQRRQSLCAVAMCSTAEDRSPGGLGNHKAQIWSPKRRHLHLKCSLTVIKVYITIEMCFQHGDRRAA